MKTKELNPSFHDVDERKRVVGFLGVSGGNRDSGFG